MSIYIYGLDKPKEKYIDIRLFNNGWAQIKTDEWPYAKGFRAIEVSQHGDLVGSSIDVNNYSDKKVLEEIKSGVGLRPISEENR